jgi:hypothetical protein
LGVKKQIGAACEVKTMDNRLLATAHIATQQAGEVELGNPGGKMPILGLGTPVKLIIHNAEQTKELQVLSGRVYVSNEYFLRLVELIDFADYEKRRFFRLDIDHSALLIVPSEDEKGEMHEGEVKIRVLNMSLCGMMFTSEKELHEGQEAKLRMTLFNNQMETLSIRVVRVIPQKEGRVNYGAELLDISPRVDQSLCAFLFREQQKQIRRTRGK